LNTVLPYEIPAASLERKAAKIPESFASRVQTFATSDICSVDLIDSFPWETLDDRRRYAKSILRLHRPRRAIGNLLFEGTYVDQGNYHLRYRDIDPILPKPQREFLKGSFKLLWKQLSNEAKLAKSVPSLS